MIALIPARAGSKRVPGKNTRLLNGHPVIAYTIAAAQQSGIFRRVLVCTDDEALMECGCAIAWRRPVPDDQPDVIWVRDIVMRELSESYSILRPTSPFRTADTIRRAKATFDAMADCGDSVRAVRPVTEHPGKMWTWDGPGSPMRPLLNETHTYHEATGFDAGIPVPWHSSPTQSLPQRYYVQTSMLDMGWTANLTVHGTIHGRKVVPFLASDVEHLSIDTEADWDRAVALAAAHPEYLPCISG